jgi:hypothetical protein
MNSNKTEISKARIINLIDSIISSFLTDVSEIKFNKYNPQQLYLMCLYGRMIELSISALNLMKANDHAGIPILIRAQMEAFVDFANLIEDKDFIKIIAATFVDQKKRLYNNLSKHLDPSEIPQPEDNCTEKILTGHKPQKIWKRFENINLEKTYISAYFILCNYAHNNLAMLEHRQLEKDEGEHRVTFFKEEPFDIFLRFAMTLGATLVDSHKILMNFFEKSLGVKTQAVCEEFAQLRKDATNML